MNYKITTTFFYKGKEVLNLSGVLSVKNNKPLTKLLTGTLKSHLEYISKDDDGECLQLCFQNAGIHHPLVDEEYIENNIKDFSYTSIIEPYRNK